MSELFQSFVPLHNPMGFGAADFIELELAVLVVLLLLAYAGASKCAQKLAAHTGWSMLLLAILPVALRVAMVSQSPAPSPAGSDDFAHLLVADTLRHLRLANPAHPMHRFFETIFVLQEPSYSSIFPIGQGLALALGSAILGHPWAGVLLSVAVLCALCYWMLRAWTTPGWALVGGLLCVIQFGPLRYWMNTYWGGAVSAVAGCLVFGSLPRLRASARVRDALLLGLGLGIQLLARPFEFLLLLAAVILFFPPPLAGPRDWRKLARLTVAAVLMLLPAAGLALLQNKQVTGSWTTLPYMLSRYQYGVPAAFTIHPNPAPHRELTANQRLDYEAQAAVHGPDTDSPAAYLQRLGGRVRFYRFFFLAPLYLAVLFFLPALREWRFAWVALTLLLLALGTNFYPYFYPHYIAAATCLFVLISVVGLAQLSRIRTEAAQLIVLLCAVHFIFWYGFHLFADRNAATTVLQYETWDFVNHGDPQGRIAVRDRLAQAPGKQLVFVRYWPQHTFGEWVRNAADIDRAAVVWALDLGPTEDEVLRHYYPDRTAWLLEPDARPPKLEPYQPEPPAPPVQKEKPSPEQNGIQLLPIE
ncbi:MAG TPA: hypothetical protein VKR61_01715 [Bryobacteraceae bacterium]|nr:hypothetical protein [Bryobacteraceae bacterium]